MNFINIIYWFVVLVITLIFHELGHILIFFMLKIKPKLHFNFVGVSVGDENIPNLRVRQCSLILVTGILIGLIPITIFPIKSIEIIMMYILISSNDINNILELLPYLFENPTMMQLMTKNYKEWKKWSTCRER